MMTKLLLFLIVPIVASAVGCRSAKPTGGILGESRVAQTDAEMTLADSIATDESTDNAIRTRLNTAYIDDANPFHTLDIYSPIKRDKPVPVLVHIHGGGWRMGSKDMMKATGMFYASQGILFIAPNYRLSPEVRHPAHVEDCAAAVAWAFEHSAEHGGDNTRLFVSGHSAGAHLAALLGTNPKYLNRHGLKPGALAGVIPVDTASFNLLTVKNERLVNWFVKQAFGTDRKVLEEASPFHNVADKNNCAKFLVLNATKREIAAAGGKAFADTLKETGCAAQFIPVDNHNHMEMAEGMCDPSDPVGKAILTFILDNKTD